MSETHITIAILVFAIGFIIYANWRERGEYEPGNLPIIPYNALQFVMIVVAFLAIAHLITLFSGQPFVGRMGGRPF